MRGTLSVAVLRRGRSTRLSRVTCTHGARDRPVPEAHDREVWTVALVRRGSFGYRSSAVDRAQILRPGWLLISAPEVAYECGHDHDGGDECVSLSVPHAVMADVASATGAVLDTVLSRTPALPPSPRVAALIERARIRGDADDLDEAGYAVVESLAAHVAGGRGAGAPTRSQVGRVHDAIDRIECSCERPLPVADLAAAAGLSPYHFLRVFRRVTGTTPHQYVVGARLRLASRLLLDTRRPVTDIAYEVGFQDLSNFVRTFHRVVGVSPGAYRR